MMEHRDFTSIFQAQWDVNPIRSHVLALHADV